MYFSFEGSRQSEWISTRPQLWVNFGKGFDDLAVNAQYGVQDLGLVTIFKGSSAEQVCLCCSGAQRARGYAAIFLIIIILFFPASTTMLAALVAPSSLRSLRTLGIAALAFLGCSLRSPHLAGLASLAKK